MSNGLRGLAAFGLPLLLVVGGVSAGVVWQQQRSAISRDDVVDVSFEELHDDLRAVRISGQANYDAVVEQRVGPTLFSQERTYYLYSFFPRYDTTSRAIPVLVRSPFPPEDLVQYEYTTLEGRLTRPTPESVGYEVEIMFGKTSEYYFSDEMFVLELFEAELE